ncbi:MAG: hypothetical protein HKO96_11390, partial [Flavobacteriaceae bacterium]|nr:hypothetical protein [Flavobacteriaceae bacterium]
MRKILLLSALILSITHAFSQNVAVDVSTYTVEELVTDVLIDSPCADISNITWSTGSDFGEQNGIGFFSEPSGLFPFNEGLLMASSSATSVAGPNTGLNDLSEGSMFGWPGDLDLTTTAQTALSDPTIDTFNATIIEFDFVPISTDISFRFLMASEEYGTPAFECTYSDIFAFYLTDEAGNTTNLAVLPDGTTPVLVTTVHPDNGACPPGSPTFYPQYFSQYTAIGGPPIRHNGYTRSFTAFSNVNPGETYHIKLAIADARDSIYDSAVFLEAGSFNLGLDLGNDILVTSGNAECDGDSVTLNTGSPSATHSWYKDGVLLPEMGSTLEVSEPGEYSVEVVFSAACQTSDSIIIEFVTNPVANPAPDLVKCDGIFDLTLNDDDILGVQNAADYTITYHESDADALAGINALVSPYLNISNPQTIHARIESVNNSNCFDITSFDIIVDDLTFSTAVDDMIACDPDNDGFVQFNLTDQDNALAASAGYALADVTLTYHETQADADTGINPLSSPYTNLSSPQAIFARVVDNASPTCFGTITFDLIVNTTPEVLNLTLEQCDEDGTPDGLTEYNLNQVIPDILVGGDPTGLSFSFHLSQSDALTSINSQTPSPFVNTINPQIIYVRVENDNSGCFAIAEVTLDVTATDVGDVSLEACEDNYDGFVQFTLSDADSVILASLPPGLTVAYYETANDAQLEVNQLPNLYTNTIPWVQTVYIRVEDANNCYGIANMDLIVNPLPDNNTVANQSFCSDTPGVGSIDLSVFDAEVIGTQNPADLLISYHESLSDAQAGMNALVSPYTNISDPQTIYVRVENIITGCSMALISFDISINPNPNLIDPTPLEVCDDNIIDGITSIDLSFKNTEITASNPSYSVSYYLTQADADSGINPLPIPYTNVSNPQTIYARGEDINTGCYATVSLDLIVEQAPVANVPPPLEFCDPDA